MLSALLGALKDWCYGLKDNILAHIPIGKKITGEFLGGKGTKKVLQKGNWIFMLVLIQNPVK